MKIQSLSVVVPNTHCINSCEFCVSKMHCDTYKNQMDDNLPLLRQTDRQCNTPRAAKQQHLYRDAGEQ